MNGYTKLFSTILTSTIWQEPIEVKVLWITMLALSDKNGYVSGSIPGLAHVAGISLEACQKGIQCLSSPDSFSRTKIEDGRRICETDGGWELVNHAKYRVLLSAEERKEYNRRKQQEHRERQRAEAVKSASNMSAKVKQCQQKPDIADADSDQIQMQDTLSQSSSGTPALPPPEPKQQKRVKRMTVPDADWLVEVKAVEAYKGIDVAREFSKAKVWFDTRGKVLSRGRFLNWLNRCERPMGSNGGLFEPPPPLNVREHLAREALKQSKST